jgi:TonB-linked SusC/RagA family outer membrane protein
MRNFYTVVSLLLLVLHQGMSQSTEVYAASRAIHPTRSLVLEASTLKAGLKEVEKFFGVSIAYKDEWVEGKTIESTVSVFKSVEQALDELLEDTGLNYKKAGDLFYVIAPAKMENDPRGSQSASIHLMPQIGNSRLVEALTLSNNFHSPLSLVENSFAIAITGTVKDESGQVFPGVNIIVKGTSIGSSTDADGKFALNVPDENAVLVFSFVGYATQEIIVGSRTSIDVVMAPDVQSLNEVVVTALGIEKPSKSLGYATTKVNSEQLTVNRTPNLMNALQGKIAGVNISGLGTGPAGTSKIRIRGQSSISGQNNPLIVINGVPIDNTNFGTNQGNTAGDNSIANKGGGASTDGGDGLSSINPDDVESMTVLKGAAAAALYGSRAKDGVIMITTKSRGTTKGIGVTYNMNYTNETPLDYTDYQYVYGQGEYGKGPSSPGAPKDPDTGQWSFGPKIQPGMTQVLFNNVVVPYEAQKNIITRFYRNGQNLTNSVSLSANGDKGGMNLSFSNMNSQGITPNNSFNRKTINLGFGHDLSEKLSFKGNVNYSNEYNKNPPVVSDQDNSIPTSLYAMANTMPLDVLKANAYNPEGGEYKYSRFTNRTNPYWVLDQVKQNIRRDRLFGNMSVKYDLTKWLFAQVRAGQDYWSRDQDYINLPTGKASINNSSILSSVPGFYNGLYTQDVRRFRETNVDFLISGTKTFGDFGVNMNVGGNQMRRRSDLNSVQVTDFVVKDLYNVQNGRAKDPIYDLQERAVNSVYGFAEINYKQFIYLNGTVRNDVFSTLAPANRSIVYPSVSASYVFSESFKSKPGWLDFGKFRAAYAEVGSDTDVPPYSDILLYGINGNLFAGLPVGNFGSNPLVVPNPNLKPMRTKETELGIEMKMFESRVNLDLAVYRKLTIDQIVNAQISDASGFTTKRINSGKSQNQGVELMLNLIPVSTDNFQWDFTFTGAYNITKVLRLLTDNPGDNITVGTHVFNGFVQQIVGKEMGQIVGYGYRRDDGSINPDHKGQIIYGSNGIALPTTGLVSFGSALPKWVGGFTNSFTYKGIVASFLIDFKLGGKVLSGTNFNAYRHGLSKETLVGREGASDADPVKGIDKGAVIGEGVDINSNVNTKPAAAEDFYSVVRGAGLIEPVIYNAGYWKLRQITIGYDFTKFFNPSSPIKGVKLSFVANNVLMLKKWVPNIDPESFSYSSDNVVGLESPSVPTTRSIGFNLNVKF